MPEIRQLAFCKESVRPSTAGCSSGKRWDLRTNPNKTNVHPENAGDSKAKVIKNTSSSCKQLELDLVLFIVQLGATGPPRYTLIFDKDTIFLSMRNFIWINLLVKLCQFVSQ